MMGVLLAAGEAACGDENHWPMVALVLGFTLIFLSPIIIIVWRDR